MANIAFELDKTKVFEENVCPCLHLFRKQSAVISTQIVGVIAMDDMDQKHSYATSVMKHSHHRML